MSACATAIVQQPQQQQPTVVVAFIYVDAHERHFVYGHCVRQHRQQQQKTIKRGSQRHLYHHHHHHSHHIKYPSKLCLSGALGLSACAAGRLVSARFCRCLRICCGRFVWLRDSFDPRSTRTHKNETPTNIIKLTGTRAAVRPRKKNGLILGDISNIIRKGWRPRTATKKRHENYTTAKRRKKSCTHELRVHSHRRLYTMRECSNVDVRSLC